MDSLTDGLSSPSCNFIGKDKSNNPRNARDLWGMAAGGEIFRFLGFWARGEDGGERGGRREGERARERGCWEEEEGEGVNHVFGREV